MSVPDDVKLDYATRHYLSSLHPDTRNLPPLEVKVHQLNKEQLEEMNLLRTALPQLQKTIKGLPTGQFIHPSKANVTKEEAQLFQESLTVKDTSQADQPGPLMELLLPPLSPDERKACSQFMKKLADRKDELLSNGNTLFGGEQCALSLYTSPVYLLVNGTINNDPTSLKQWLKGMGYEDPTTEESKNCLKKGQEKVPQLVEMILSGLQKLPAYGRTLYRGDAIPKEQLEDWKEGKILMTEKVFSCSTKERICEDFAASSAVSYMWDTHKAYKPVLYVIEAKNAKSISEYSLSPREDEYVYPPGQLLRTVAVDEETVPGLAIIYLQEEN